MRADMWLHGNLSPVEYYRLTVRDRNYLYAQLKEKVAKDSRSMGNLFKGLFKR